MIEEPLLRLVSVDLGATADITNFPKSSISPKTTLGLLKAAVIASGIVPPGMKAPGRACRLLAQMVGPGRGLEIVSSVNNIPKGSRLAVSTNLLAALITRLHAGDGAGRFAHRSVARRRTAARSRARDPGRMDGRLRRRLAGFRRRLAGHETD